MYFGSALWLGRRTRAGVTYTSYNRSRVFHRDSPFFQNQRTRTMLLSPCWPAAECPVARSEPRGTPVRAGERVGAARVAETVECNYGLQQCYLWGCVWPRCLLGILCNSVEVVWESFPYTRARRRHTVPVHTNLVHIQREHAIGWYVGKIFEINKRRTKSERLRRVPRRDLW